MEVRLVKSLQRKVAVITSVAIGAALVLGVSGAQMAEKIEQHHHLDTHLAEVAQTVSQFSQDNATQADLTRSQPPRRYAPPDANLDLSFQVWLNKGPLLLETNMSANAAALMPLNQFGFANAMVNGQPGRVFALPSPDRSYTVQVAEQFEDRDNDTQTLLRYYFLPIALPLLFSMVATWFLLRRSADALDELVLRLRSVDVKNLQPVSIDQPSQEILPVIQEFNTVFQRASQALQSEQRFTAMAAHELRTPMAGIRAQAQLALGSDTDQERQEALQAVIGGVKRASHMFDQLFDLTRLDSVGSDGGRRQIVAFDTVFQQVMDELSGRLEARHVLLTTDWKAPTLFGLEFAVFLLLRNLIANAILYGPDRGHIQVLTWSESGAVVLCVDDSGKGIAEVDRPRAFERFNRLGQRGTEGVGLGLSIVQMVAELHGGQVALQDSPLGGLRVRVNFPDPQRPATPPPNTRSNDNENKPGTD